MARHHTLCCVLCSAMLFSGHVARALSAPANDLLLRAARGERVDRTPVWLFRQAGRHMQEYRDYKEKTGKHFLDLLEDPKDVAEVTMQPLRRYDVDAAILFSDILVVPQALGVKVTMPGGVGIQVPDPITDPDRATELAALASEDPDRLVVEKLSHVTSAVSAIREKQLSEGKDCALLGFSAAPWTLFYYTVGANSRDSTPADTFASEHAKETEGLLDAYQGLVESYCSAQVQAGAHAIQIFEAMGASLSSEDFNALALPRLLALGESLKRKHPTVPLLVFARGVADPTAVNAKLKDVYDVVTLDTTANRVSTRAAMPATCLQGNLDPTLLVLGQDDDLKDAKHRIDAAVADMLADFDVGACQSFIANLGEGLSGKESQDLVEYFVDAVHAQSETALRPSETKQQPSPTTSR